MTVTHALMNDGTRPLLLGYIRALGLTDDEIAEAKLTLAAYAGSEGYALGTIYVERTASPPAAFHALLDEIRRDNDVWAVVVPAPYHEFEKVDPHGLVHVLCAHP